MLYQSYLIPNKQGLRNNERIETSAKNRCKATYSPVFGRRPKACAQAPQGGLELTPEKTGEKQKQPEKRDQYAGISSSS